jgi:hypothetical protein
MKQDKQQYPAATIAFYGPDDKHATKVVVAIVPNATADPDPLRRWMGGITDVRADKKIGDEIQAFLAEHGVKQVVATDRIIGCPHESGKDYPEGIDCPFCSFWTKRNRFTHEIEE